jgi:tripartite-type tricarboxylate transporter receptor subunit TctC
MSRTFSAVAVMSLIAAFVAFSSSDLAAQSATAPSAVDYPTKPIRLIVPYPPGGATDVTAREISQSLGAVWGRPLVVDNRAGAAGTVGHAMVAKAVPDGYTLVVGTFGGLVSGPALLGASVPYDPTRDFAPMGLAVYTPWVLVAHPGLPANTVKELIELSKKSPGKLNYASTGTGTPNHLGMVLLMVHAKIDMLHVPYRGAGPAIVDLLAGRVQTLFSGVPQVIPHVKSGRMKVIGVGHSTRIRALPDVPTIAESVPGFYNSGYYGLLAPAKTPVAIVEKVNAALTKVFSAPDTVTRVEAQGLIASPSSPGEFGELIARDLALWRQVIKSTGLTVESTQ